MKLKYVAIFLVLLCCLMGASSAAEDVSTDVVSDSVDDVAVDAVSDDISDSVDSVVVDSASDSDILKDSEIYIDKDTTDFSSDFYQAMENIENNGVIHIDEGTFDTSTFGSYSSNDNSVTVVGKGIDKTILLITDTYPPDFCADFNVYSEENPTLTISNLTFASTSSKSAINFYGNLVFENVKFLNVNMLVGYSKPYEEFAGRYSDVSLESSIKADFNNCIFQDFHGDSGIPDKIVYPINYMNILGYLNVFTYYQANFNGCTFKNISDDSLIHMITFETGREDGINVFNSSFIDCNVKGYFDLQQDLSDLLLNVENCWFESNNPNAEKVSITDSDGMPHNYLNLTNGYIIAKLTNTTAIDYKNPTTFTVSLVSVVDGVETDYEGSGFANIPLTYTINGETKDGEIVNGVFTFDAQLTSQSDVVKVNVGSQELTVELPEPPVEPETNDTPVVPPKVATKITAPKVTATYNVAKKLVITLTDKDGKALANKKVTVKVGTISKTLNTNAKGQVSLNVATLVPKTYTATVKFAGDDSYIASSLSPKVVISKAKPQIVAKAKTFKVKTKTKKYTVTLKNNKGKVLKKVKLTLKVGKKTYKATTNSKGKATFKITKLTKKGKYTATIKFAGSKYYKALSKKAKITVKK